MARPIKESLSYFPLDSDFFSDRKIRRLLKTFGGEGRNNLHLCAVRSLSPKRLLYSMTDFTFQDISDALGERVQ